MPPLAERQEDLPLLANHFLKIFAKQQQKQTEYFHESLLDFMRQREWPGNIRERENFVERVVTLASPTTIQLDASVLPKEIQVEFSLVRAGEVKYVAFYQTSKFDEKAFRIEYYGKAKIFPM